MKEEIVVGNGNLVVYLLQLNRERVDFNPGI